MRWYTQYCFRHPGNLQNTTLVNEMVHTILLQSTWQCAKYHFSQSDGTHNTASVILAMWGQNTTLVNAMVDTILHTIKAVITQYCSSHPDTVAAITTLLVNSSANLATWHEIKESCKHQCKSESSTTHTHTICASEHHTNDPRLVVCLFLAFLS